MRRLLNRKRFLRLDLLQAGDVVLSTSGEHPSTTAFIKAATAGPFAHAALVVSPGWWFESDLLGNFCTHVPPEDAGFVEGKVVLLADVSAYRRLAVYRHPAIGVLDEAGQGSLE